MCCNFLKKINLKQNLLQFFKNKNFETVLVAKF